MPELAALLLVGGGMMVGAGVVVLVARAALEPIARRVEVALSHWPSAPGPDRRGRGGLVSLPREGVPPTFKEPVTRVDVSRGSAPAPPDTTVPPTVRTDRGVFAPPEPVPRTQVADPGTQLLGLWNRLRPTRETLPRHLAEIGASLPGRSVSIASAPTPLIALLIDPPLYEGHDLVLMPDMGKRTNGLIPVFRVDGGGHGPIDMVRQPAHVSARMFDGGRLYEMEGRGLAVGEVTWRQA